MAGYPGNKSNHGSYQQIINHFPKHTNFISGCAGSGIVELIKKPAAGKNIAFELDEKVIRKYWAANTVYKVLQQDSVLWLQKQKQLDQRTLIFFDPPYLHSARASGKLYYRYEWTEKQHLDFLQAVKQSKANICIVHYPCDLYETELQQWHRHQWNTRTHTGNRIECLYMNYAKPRELHQYNYLGDNFTKRQQVKRIKERFLNRLNNYSDLHRYAIIEALEQYLGT